MSKKKIYNKHLEKGRFYIHSDGHGGHPALLYKKRDKNNEYYVVVFTSSPGPKRIKLKYSIEPIKVEISFVHSSPKKSKRRDLGSRPLVGSDILPPLKEVGASCSMTLLSQAQTSYPDVSHPL